MSLGTTVILYLLIGVGVAVAVAARGGSRGELAFHLLAAVPFWPLFVPLLLSENEGRPQSPQRQRGTILADAAGSESSFLAGVIEFLGFPQAARVPGHGAIMEKTRLTDFGRVDQTADPAPFIHFLDAACAAA